jgi:hypothetical protein
MDPRFREDDILRGAGKSYFSGNTNITNTPMLSQFFTILQHKSNIEGIYKNM